MQRNPTLLLKISLLINISLVGILYLNSIPDEELHTFYKILYQLQTPTPVPPLNATKYNVDQRFLNPSKLVPFQLETLSQPALQRYPQFTQRGEYWVAYNKISPLKYFYGNESITLTTQSDHTKLDNLILLVKRWQGPISCAVYSPGTDYLKALKIIHYLRSCAPLIKSLVTFHLFFHTKHIPRNNSAITWENIKTARINCTRRPKFGRKVKTYRKIMSLQYPINIARNIAREAALTHFIFPSDVELYPSKDLIPDFLRMINNTNSWTHPSPQPKVYVLPVFELKENITSIPGNKAELKSLINMKLALPFHQHLCNHCHSFPRLKEWSEQDIDVSQLKTFSIVKRRGQQASWEPFYIGTNSDPTFDERFTWERRNNKKIQAFTMCLLDYEFHILNKAFLVHRPEKIKTFTNTQVYYKMRKLLNSTIIPEVINLYGEREGCQFLLYL